MTSWRFAPGGSGPLRPGAHTRTSRVAPGAATALTSRPIASRWESLRWLKQLHVEEQRESRADTSAAQRRDVAFDESDIDALGLCASPCRLDRLGYHVDAHDLPAAPRQLHRPPSGATPEIEGRSVRRLAPSLHEREERVDLRSQRRGILFPWREANPVREAVPATHGSSTSPADGKTMATYPAGSHRFRRARLSTPRTGILPRAS